MKNLWFPLMLLFILLNVSACNAEQECPVEVQVETRNDKSYPYNVIVTSVTDSITINDVIVNRGNAKPFWSVEKPVTIKFGEIVSEQGFSRAPKEIEVQTDMGNWTFRP